MSEIARLMADSTERLLQQHPEATTHGLSEKKKGDKLLAALRETGLDLALAPEQSGGSGLSLAEASEITLAWGRVAACGPIVELLLAPCCATQFSDQGLGETATLSCVEDLQVDMDNDHVQSVKGSAIEAALFPGCDRVYARAQSEQGRAYLLAIPLSGHVEFENLAEEPWSRIEPDEMDVSSLNLVEIGDKESELLGCAGALLTTSAMVGAMEAVLALVIEYTNTRKQFGRPLSRFQAIQHSIAEAAAELEITRAALNRSLRGANGGAPTALQWCAVKAQAGRAVSSMAAKAHQAFGAIGFTQEHMLHHYTKRFWTWRDDWGRQSVCEERLGRMAIGGTGQQLWEKIADL